MVRSAEHLDPGAEEVIRHHETDWRKVVAWLTGPIPGGKDIFYQKQMTHHLLPEIDRQWLLKVTNCFLIRDPREMLTSDLKIVPNPTDEDTGYPQQLEIFRFVRERTGKTPPVLDTRDVLQNPERMLRALCEALDVPFREAMLSWPPGLRETDGVWAPYWYKEVLTSTTFRPYRPKPDQVPLQFHDLWERCQAIYEELYQYRLT